MLAALAATILLAVAPTAYWVSRLAPWPTPTTALLPGKGSFQDETRSDFPSPASPSVVASEDVQAAHAANDNKRDLDAQAREERYAQWMERWRADLPKLGDRLGLNDANAPTVRGAAAVSELTDRLRSPVSASIESTLNVLRAALPSATAEQDRAKPQAIRYPSAGDILS
jgi:hypothetical protein